eukprot:21857-Karenia_brevis.AAC.1
MIKPANSALVDEEGRPSRSEKTSTPSDSKEYNEYSCSKLLTPCCSSVLLGCHMPAEARPKTGVV